MSAEPTKTPSNFIQDQLALIKEKTGIPAPIVLGTLVVCIGFVFMRQFEVNITTLVGTLFPIYWSVKAIESAETDDDKQWLTYWVVFSCLMITDLYCESRQRSETIFHLHSFTIKREARSHG